MNLQDLNVLFRKLLPGEFALVRSLTDWQAINYNLQKIADAYNLQFPYVNSPEKLKEALTIIKSRLGLP